MVTLTTLVAQVKPYLRVDGDYDDDVITSLVLSANAKLKGSGVKEPGESVDEEMKELYKLAIKMLVSHWYENREQEAEGRTQHVITLGVQSIILDLKAGGLVEDSKQKQTD